MNTLLNLYFRLPYDLSLGIVSKAFNRLVAKFIKLILDRTVPKYFLKTQKDFPRGINNNPSDKKIIVSFTSFPERIEDVWIVVECLFRQSYKADKIILWLSESQFEGIKLPESLLNQVKRGLEIFFVKDDMKSHKKYLYAFEKYPNDYIITVDDDLYYDNGFIQNLIKMKSKYPNEVVTNRAHQITFSEIGGIKKYSNWNHNITSHIPSYLTVQTGGFGTMYTKEDLFTSFNDIELIKKYIPYADDLWLKIQTLLVNKKIVTNNRYNKDPISVRNSQMQKLVKINVFDGGNDSQFKSVLEYFQLGNLEYFRNKM
jgi:hypothetical protein